MYVYRSTTNTFHYILFTSNFSLDWGDNCICTKFSVIKQLYFSSPNKDTPTTVDSLIIRSEGYKFQSLEWKGDKSIW